MNKPTLIDKAVNFTSQTSQFDIYTISAVNSNTWIVGMVIAQYVNSAPKMIGIRTSSSTQPSVANNNIGNAAPNSHLSVSIVCNLSSDLKVCGIYNSSAQNSVYIRALQFTVK
jgi:hypothetical protein